MKTFLSVILYLAVAALVYYIYQRQTQSKKYYDYIANLGFGSYWLDQLNASELETLYSYIHDFTQKGIAVYSTLPIYDKLTRLEKKYPALFPGGIKKTGY